MAVEDFVEVPQHVSGLVEASYFTLVADLALPTEKRIKLDGQVEDLTLQNYIDSLGAKGIILPGAFLKYGEGFSRALAKRQLERLVRASSDSPSLSPVAEVYIHGFGAIIKSHTELVNSISAPNKDSTDVSVLLQDALLKRKVLLSNLSG